MLDVDCLTQQFSMPSGLLRVLNGVSFRLKATERLAIMGPSGSGKSTLLSILGALEKPTSGTVRLGGVDIGGLDMAGRAAFRNQQIGFVFQEHHLLAGCTALDNVLLPALATGCVSPSMVVCAEGLLARVGLANRAHHMPAELSGGERQRVAVARALSLSPQLILADEPTGQLDAQAAASVSDLLVEMANELGSILIVATHSQSVASRIGSICQLHSGLLLP